jgi:hypothetical protein
MKLQRENADFFCKETMVSINELEKFKRYCQAIAVFVPDRFRGDEANGIKRKNPAPLCGIFAFI